MLLFAAAAIAASAPQTGNRTAAPAVQTTATVRIVSGVRLAFGKTRNGDGFRARDTVLRAAVPTQPLKLIEYE
jgi:hypothetical protein